MASKRKPKRVTYQDHIILTEGQADEAAVTVDGKSIDVLWEQDEGRYSTPLLPYTTYDSLEDLAKAVARYVPSMRKANR
jgi:hypothetical protein